MAHVLSLLQGLQVSAIVSSCVIGVLGAVISGQIGFRLGRALASSRATAAYGLLLLFPAIIGDLAYFQAARNWTLAQVSSSTDLRSAPLIWSMVLLNVVAAGAPLFAVFVWLRLRGLERSHLELANMWSASSKQRARFFELPRLSGVYHGLGIIVFADGLFKSFGVVGALKLSRGSAVDFLSPELTIMRRELTQRASDWSGAMLQVVLSISALAFTLAVLVVAIAYQLEVALSGSGDGTTDSTVVRKMKQLGLTKVMVSREKYSPLSPNLTWSLSVAAPGVFFLAMLLVLFSSIRFEWRFFQVSSFVDVLGAFLAAFLVAVALVLFSLVALSFARIRRPEFLQYARLSRPEMQVKPKLVLRWNEKAFSILVLAAVFSLVLEPTTAGIMLHRFGFPGTIPDWAVWSIGETVLWISPTLLFVSLTVMKTSRQEVEWMIANSGNAPDGMGDARAVLRRLMCIKVLFFDRHRGGIFAILLLLTGAIALDTGVAELLTGFRSIAEIADDLANSRSAFVADLPFLLLILTALLLVGIVLLAKSMTRSERNRA